MGTGITNGSEMRGGKVNNMDIVTLARAIARVIVIAENAQHIPPTDCDLGNERHQIVGNIIGVFTNQSRFMCSDRIEISKQNRARIATCLHPVAQHALNMVFGAPIGVFRRKWVVFVIGQVFCCAINSGRGRKHNSLAFCRVHRLQQRNRALHIVLVIFHREKIGLAHRFQAGKMDHDIRIELAKDARQLRLVTNIAFDLIEVVVYQPPHAFERLR